ncbi:MAG: flagellin [Alteromonadaceae bacterium]|nr:flagellin [Alteromonadaceae bacterium]
MPSVVNTNVMSLNAQRQLNKSQLTQNTAMERLSSGLRINSAKDDAAGLAISTGMSSQIRGLNQAVRNANDGISMAQTAEGSMDEMTNILQRMRELSVQSANDTNSASNRASIQIEVDQLYEELDRIATTTSFNGINLLDGSNKSTSLQIGSESGQSLSFSINAVTTKDLNLNAVSGLGELNGGRVNTGSVVDSVTVTINGVTISGAANVADRAAGIVASVNASTGLTGVTASAYNTVEGTAGQTGVTSALQINGTTLGNTSSMTDLVETINRDVAGITASLNSEGGLVLSNDTGNQIDIGTGTAGSGLVTDDYQGFVSLTSADGGEITIGTDASKTTAQGSTGAQQLGLMISTGSDNVTGSAVGSTAVTSSDGIQINGVDLGAVTGTTAADKAFAINAISDETGVTASATTQVKFEINISGIQAETALVINGVSLDFTQSAGVSVNSIDELVTQINGAGIQGVVATADATTGQLVLTSQAGSDIDIYATTGVGANAVVEGLNIGGAGQTAHTAGSITLTGEDGKDVVITSKATNQGSQDTALAKIGVTSIGGSETAVGIGLSVNSVANANNSIDRIDSALKQISDGRANLGAIQNRLGSTISNLQNVSQNISAANSRISDADFAVETSTLSKSQILQQAGTAMLSQANASTQNVLSLLG